MRSLKDCYRRFREWQLNPFDYTNHSQHPERCANCGTEFSDNYCPRCGQKSGTGPIGWRTVRQGVMLIWGMDSRSLGYSLLQLLLRPGYMISDYISGKRQVSFPPVKMLLLIAILNMIVTYIAGEPFTTTPEETTNGDIAFYEFDKWSESNMGWAMLITTCAFILPTWLFFRYSPKHSKHTLPEGFFVQVFMSSLLTMIAIPITIFDNEWFLILWPISYIVAYRQLFGYGWWGTLWRFFITFFMGFAQLTIVIWVANIILGGRHDSTSDVAYVVGITIFFTLVWFAIEKLKSR